MDEPKALAEEKGTPLNEHSNTRRHTADPHVLADEPPPAVTAIERTLFLLRRAHELWQDRDGQFWMAHPSEGGPTEVTALITPLISAGWLQVNRAELPISRGPFRGGRWLQITSVGRQVLADAARREENALPPARETPRKEQP